MKLKLNIFYSVWVNLLVIFSISYTSIIIYTLTTSNESFIDTIMIALLGSLYGILAFGFIFWVMFIVSTLVIDLFLPFKEESKLNRNLLIEWIAVCSPFFLLIFTSQMYVFLIGIIPYFISQFTLRKAKVEKIYHLLKEEDLVNQIN